MIVKNVKRDVFAVPENVMVEAELERALLTLYKHGVSVERYRAYFAKQYELDAIQEGREREAVGHEQGDLL